jgi:protocatechuate 3,4-dioxygenase beta subunit
LTLAEGGVCQPVAASGLFDPNWKLEDRVAGLLDPRRTPMKRLRPWTIIGFTAVLLAVCTVGAAIRAGGEPAKNDNTDTKNPKEAVVAADVSKAVIEGVVADEAGKPVGGAVVRVVSYTPSPGPMPARTAADGTFRLFLNQASARYTVVIASAEDGARQGIYEFHDTVLPQTVQARIVVKPSRKMTVRVTDASKKPVEDAAVGVAEYGSWAVLANAETDAHGAVSLRLPRDARIFQVVALKPHVGLDYFENYPSWPVDHFGEPPAQVDLVLDGARTISVRAVDSADKPLAGVELNPWTVKKKGKFFYVNLGGSAMKYVSAHTDHDGLAAFDWIPTDVQESVTILNEGREYSLPNLPRQDPKPPYVTLTAKLFHSTPISGKVTLPDGKPAAGVLLQVEGIRFRNVVRTKADGSYSILVCPNQTYVIAVTDENWAAPSYTGVVVGDESPPVRFDFHLGKGATLRGKATVGPDDKPAPNKAITVIEQGTLVRWAETGLDGRYAIRIGPGHYRIRGPLQRDQPEGITVKEEQTIDKDFHLARLSELEVLKGVVLAETVDGKPVGGAILRGMAARFDGSGEVEGVADEKGRFELRRPPVRTFLYARNPEGTLAAIVTIGEDDETVKVVLSPAGKLLGRVLDKSGQPEKGASILYGPRIGPQEKPFNTYMNTHTDAAGRFTLLGVVPGADCSIRVFGKTNRKIKVVPAMKAETLDLGDFVCEPKD